VSKTASTAAIGANRFIAHPSLASSPELGVIVDVFHQRP